MTREATRQSLAGLYVITDDRLLAGCLLSAVEVVVAAGCRLVQYRSKQPDVARKQQEAAALVGICHRHGARLLVNDDPVLALQVGADGVHLGQDDMPLLQARALLGEQAIIGITCHQSLSLAEAAASLGADYVAFGRFFDSHTKPDAALADLAVLERARQCLPCPVVAIGGITLDNAATVVHAGADMVAVAGGVFAGAATDLADLSLRVRQFQSLFSHQQSGTV